MDFKKIEKMTERRCIARKKIQEVAQELYDFAKENAISIAGEHYSYMYATAYSGCYGNAVGDREKEIAIIDDGKVVEPTLLNEPRKRTTTIRDYGCWSPKIANTKEMKEWIIKQIHLIKNEDNFEEEFLKEIKEMLNRH
ncbi:MAG: hypothetical protein M0R03_23665 [Novosphingobium sp.]|nr:hypothetical protein [Novosphingobium sp.]